MMICKKTEEEWQAYWDGTLDQETSFQLELHISRCPVCLSRFQEVVKQEDEMLEKIFGPPSDLSETIMSEIMEESHFSGQEAGPERTLNEAVPQRPLDLEKRAELTRKEQPQSDSRRPSLRGRMWLHYGVAAVLALFLLGSGVFDQAVAYSEQSTELVKETGSWITETKGSVKRWLETLKTDGMIQIQEGSGNDAK